MKNYDDFTLTTPEKMEMLEEKYQEKLSSPCGQSLIIDIKNTHEQSLQDLSNQNTNSITKQNDTQHSDQNIENNPTTNNSEQETPARRQNNNVFILLIIIIILHNRVC